MSLPRSPIFLLAGELALLLVHMHAAMAQEPTTVLLNYKQPSQHTTVYPAVDAFFITITGVDHDTKAQFLDSTKVDGGDFHASLSEAVKNATENNLDTIKANTKPSIDKLSFNLSDFHLAEGDTLFMRPYLNGKLTDSSIKIYRIKEKTTDAKTESLACPVDTVQFTDEGMFAGIRSDQIVPSANVSGSSPDFLVFYDYQTGNYYTYKLKKNASGKEVSENRVMLQGSSTKDGLQRPTPTAAGRFRYVSAKRRNPSAGDQFKYEVVNKPIDEQLSLHVTYDDYYLDEGSTFSAFFTGKVQAMLFPGKTADTASSEHKTTLEGKLTAPDCDSLMLVKLEKQLDDYGRRFPINSVTIARNLQNIAVIRKRIDSAFGLHGKDLETLAVRDGFGPTLVAVIKDISKKLDGLTDAKPLFFSTARLHDNDVLNIQIKDGTQNVVKDESFRIGWGIKIDFSVGVFLSGLTDRTYTFKDTLVQISDGNSSSPRDTSGRILIPEKKDDMSLGFGTLAHVYTRVSSNLNAGLVCGVMSNSDLNLRLLAGGSLMFSSLFGSHMRVAFSGGISWGQVKRLSEAYETGYHTEAGKPYFYPSNINAPNTVNVWRNSWFFGMTFNFGKK